MSIHSDTFELGKVTFIGTSGLLATVTIAEVSAVVSLGVGLITFSYVCAKLYFLVKHKGRNSSE